MPFGYVLETWEPSLAKGIRLGKFVQTHTGRWAYCVDLAAGDRLRQLRAWGIAPCVLKAMRERNVGTIRLHVKGEQYDLVVSLEDALRYGHLSSFEGRTSRHYHVPEDRWQRVRRMITPFVRDILTLPWIDELPARELDPERQMALL